MPRSRPRRSGPTSRTVADDEVFVTLMRVAREDREIGDRLRAMLRLDDFQRNSLLHTWLEELRLKGAPRDFVAAVAELTDAGVARRALELLER